MDGSIQFNDESSDSTLLKKSKISLLVEGESLQFDREKIRNSEGREFIFHDFIYSHFFKISSTLTTAPPAPASKQFFLFLSYPLSHDLTLLSRAKEEFGSSHTSSSFFAKEILKIFGSSDSSVIWVPPSSQEMVPVSTQRSSGEGDYASSSLALRGMVAHLLPSCSTSSREPPEGRSALWPT
jgi:hypothetical protein